MEITTIKLSRDVKKRLDDFKFHPRETYDESLQRALDILVLCKINPEHARHKIKELERMRAILKKRPAQAKSNSSPILSAQRTLRNFRP